MSVPKAGDILQLSQIAWKISRTFTAGRKDAPSEFQEIEVEVSGLSKTLKLFAECLHTDDSQALLARANTDVQSGVATIFKSCQKTVNDLDSLVDQYQVIKKHRTVGGFAIERSWGDLILAKYRTVMWTAEGGTMRNLKDLLQMHASCILILVKALQR